jgi:hypothetical protein
MRISKRFKLGVTQYQLDFVDVDTSRDARLFVDPHFLARRPDRWSIDATASVQSFFSHFLDLLQQKDLDGARQLFSHLGEPNDTCLGLSRGKPRGNGVGETLADDMFDSLVNSKAAQTGVLSDLEDARIFVRGIDKDRLSDITTALIRRHLLEYTEAQCQTWGIPLQADVPSGDVWDSTTSSWTSYLTKRIVIGERPLLLVPKAIVSFSKRYTAKNFHQHFVLTFLKHEHLRLDTALVQKRKKKDGSVRRWVTKKSIVDHEPAADKDYLADFTARHPAVFADFKAKAADDAHSLPDEELTDIDIDDVIRHLVDVLKATPTGNDHASGYHRLVTGALELCFYPALINPRTEFPIHEGRKRIDITFDNAAPSGFFHRLHDVSKIPSAFIMVECKNYSRDVKNPELDQLSGRFGINRGKVGLLVSRTVDDLDTLLQRCADAHRDGRGLILPLTDADLVVMLHARAGGAAAPYEEILTERYRRIALV